MSSPMSADMLERLTKLEVEAARTDAFSSSSLVSVFSAGRLNAVKPLTLSGMDCIRVIGTH
jgi:hypothetical protein